MTRSINLETLSKAIKRAEEEIALFPEAEFPEEHAEARALVATGKWWQSMQWRPIETAPRDGRFVLLHVPSGLESGTVTVGAYYRCEERAEDGRFKKGNWDGWLGMDADVQSSWCDPTHWMPLPAPPKDTP